MTVGFNLANDTMKAALANPNIWFIGVDQSACVDTTGKVDPTFACKGDAKTLLPNYTPFVFKEDQAGYLAGIVAASASKTGTHRRHRRHHALQRLRPLHPGLRARRQVRQPEHHREVRVRHARLLERRRSATRSAARAFAQNFIQTVKPDVLFQVAGATGNGVLDAACAAGIYAVGVDVDQYLSYPNADKCIITTAEKHLRQRGRRRRSRRSPTARTPSRHCTTPPTTASAPRR